MLQCLHPEYPNFLQKDLTLNVQLFDLKSTPFLLQQEDLFSFFGVTKLFSFWACLRPGSEIITFRFFLSQSIESHYQYKAGRLGLNGLNFHSD